MAISQMRGGFGNDLKALRQQLIDFAALIELELDFSEEDVEFADRQRFVALINQIQQQIKPLMNSFKLGNALKNGVPVAIAGKPNVGKSTLLNALLNEERAIVSPIAGTTRDTIEEVLHIDGVAYRFIDTAGLRNTTDSIEQLGVERSYEKIKKADILLYVMDINTFNNQSDTAEELLAVQSFKLPYLIVANKADTCLGKLPEMIAALPNCIVVAAKNKQGIEELKQAIGQLFVQQHQQPEGEIISNARHYHGLLNASNALNEVLNGIAQNLPTEMIAFDVRTASQYLAEITGDISNNDILDSIFTRFCIGK
jgi:tRNA modification GTPase